MKNLFLCASFLAATALPMQSIAQFGGLPQLPGRTGLPATSGGSSSASSLVATYVSANKDVLLANALLAESLGLKDQAAIARATAEALTEGATKDNLEESNKVVNSSSAAVEQAMKRSPQLDAQSQKLYSDGTARLGTGLLKYLSMRSQASAFSSSNPSAALSGAQSGLYVVSTLPKSISNLSATLKITTAFAKDNNIPVPPDATKALAAL